MKCQLFSFDYARVVAEAVRYAGRVLPGISVCLLISLSQVAWSDEDMEDMPPPVPLDTSRSITLTVSETGKISKEHGLPVLDFHIMQSVRAYEGFAYKPGAPVPNIIHPKHKEIATDVFVIYQDRKTGSLKTLICWLHSGMCWHYR